MDIFEGKKFTVQNGYLKRGNKALHRMVWEHHHGPIPKGHHIHHKDGNKLNNAIENLECLSHQDHLRLHALTSRKRLEWHKSEEGRKELGNMSKERWKNREKKTLSCKHCQTDFECIQADRAKYCSEACVMAARRTKKVDVIERACVICSTPFSINRYYKTLTCGYTCGSKYRTRNAKGTRATRVKS